MTRVLEGFERSLLIGHYDFAGFASGKTGKKNLANSFVFLVRIYKPLTHSLYSSVKRSASTPSSNSTEGFDALYSFTGSKKL